MLDAPKVQTFFLCDVNNTRNGMSYPHELLLCVFQDFLLENRSCRMFHMDGSHQCAGFQCAFVVHFYICLNTRNCHTCSIFPCEMHFCDSKECHRNWMTDHTDHNGGFDSVLLSQKSLSRRRIYGTKLKMHICFIAW